MNKLFVINICAIILFSGSFGYIMVKTETYDDVKSGIVEVLCLSCIKLQPKTSRDFTFKTVENQAHPDFVLDALKTEGPILMQYGYEGCDSCDVMIKEVMKPFFHIEYIKNQKGVKLSFETEVNIENLSFYYIYINIDDPNLPIVNKDSWEIYDKDNIGGFPQFTIITLNYGHSGEIKPYYTTLYGEFEETNYEKAKMVFKEILEESMDLYNRNIIGYR